MLCDMLSKRLNRKASGYEDVVCRSVVVKLILQYILILLEQNALNVAPNLTTKDSRRDWETAFNTSVVAPVLTVCPPSFALFTLFSFLFLLFYCIFVVERDYWIYFYFFEEPRREDPTLFGAFGWRQSSWYVWFSCCTCLRSKMTQSSRKVKSRWSHRGSARAIQPPVSKGWRYFRVASLLLHYFSVTLYK